MELTQEAKDRMFETIKNGFEALAIKQYREMYSRLSIEILNVENINNISEGGTITMICNNDISVTFNKDDFK